MWSEEEERVFWTEIIPSSNKRHLFDRPHNNEAAGWESLRQVMQRRMGRLARRRYTALMLCKRGFCLSVLLSRALLSLPRLTFDLQTSISSRTRSLSGSRPMRRRSCATTLPTSVCSFRRLVV